MLKTDTDTGGYDAPEERLYLLVVAVERTREHAKELAADKKSTLWAALDFSRRTDQPGLSSEAINSVSSSVHVRPLPLAFHSIGSELGLPCHLSLGHPEQIGAITLAYHSDHCQCLPLSLCTWCVCTHGPVTK